MKISIAVKALAVVGVASIIGTAGLVSGFVAGYKLGTTPPSDATRGLKAKWDKEDEGN